MSRQKMSAKKEQFTRPEKSKLPLILGVVIVALVVAFAIFRLSNPGQADTEFFGEPVASPRSYLGRLVSMTEVEPVVEDGKIKILFSEVEANDIVYFEVANDEGTLVPLMAYITPSGRVFAGSSMCEPCRGRTFSLAGETLVCDNCRTTYSIESHEFIAGSVVCGAYPPVNMQGAIEGDMLVIPLSEVLTWRVRSL